MRLTFDVPGPAVPKGRPRVTSRGTFTPKRTVEYEKRVKLAALAARPVNWPLDRRYKVTLLIVPLRPKKVDAKPRGGDADNVLKGANDAMNGVVWLDDAQVSEIHVVRRLPSRRPGIRVVVEFTDELPWQGDPEEWPEYQAARTPKKAPRAQRRARP